MNDKCKCNEQGSLCGIFGENTCECSCHNINKLDGSWQTVPPEIKNLKLVK